MYPDLLQQVGAALTEPGLCRKMQNKVVAEGVETEARHAALRKMGCKQGQGFLYARPREAVRA